MHYSVANATEQLSRFCNDNLKQNIGQNPSENKVPDVNIDTENKQKTGDEIMIKQVEQQ